MLRRAGLANQSLEVGEPWLRCEGSGLPVGAEHPEQASHRRECLTGGRLDRREVLGLRGVLRAEAPSYRRGLDGHHADRVGDDVVQLAGDPGPLLDRPLEQLRRCQRPLRPRSALAHEHADGPRVDGEHQRRAEVARLEPGRVRRDHGEQERNGDQDQAGVAARQRRFGAASAPMV